MADENIDERMHILENRQQEAMGHFSVMAKALVDLRAENIALWQYLKRRLPEEPWPPAEVAMAVQSLKSHGAAALALSKKGLSELPVLLESLIRHPPE